jgi:hypothetical protein
MKKLILLAGLLLCSSAIAGEKFNPKGKACNFEKFLKNLVRAEKEAPRANTFFLAESIDHPEGEFWVYWPEGRKLFLVGWPASDCLAPSLVMRRQLDLLTDVVATDAEVKGSTALVTEAWAGSVLLAAARSKHRFSVTK